MSGRFEGNPIVIARATFSFGKALATLEPSKLLEETKMKLRTYILLLAVMTFALSLPVHAQEQGTTQGSAQSSSAQSGPQGASVLPASTVDTQGIRKYVLGPGDV